MKTSPSVVLGILISIVSLRARSETTEEFLRRFHANPSVMMQRLPSEVLRNGSTRERGFIDENAVTHGRERHEETRKRIRQSHFALTMKTMGEAPGAAAPSMAPKDLAAKLVDSGPLIWRLQDMEERKLLRRKLADPPWADSYWPLYKGMIGIRYADPDFPDSPNWPANHDYVLSRSALSIWDSGDPQAIDHLSPSEKYDLALDDRDLTLTQFAWAEGAKQMQSFGTVSSWMGICHGWAGASHVKAAVPAHSVVVTAVNGRRVTFYPEDVKALQSMLWANAEVPTRFVGSRCDVSNPSRNANGRIVDPKCFDVDPATWHLAVANQLGEHQKSFVMDSTYDLEVWNYPLAGYDVTYFNPQTWQENRRLRTAMIPRAQYTLDKFPEFRAPDTAFIVGVVMDITHVEAIQPTPYDPVTPPTKTLRFIYDLELDSHLNVIGGEWYTNAHPDFIWTFASDAQAYATGEEPISKDSWAPDHPVPSTWTSYAKKSSSYGEPLFSFVGKLGTGPKPPPPQ